MVAVHILLIESVLVIFMVSILGIPFNLQLCSEIDQGLSNEDQIEVWICILQQLHYEIARANYEL
jgi:hypothetical protein